MAKEKQLTFVERLIAEATGNGLVLGAPDDPAKAQFPLLWEWLSTVYVGREYIKSPPTVTLNLVPSGVSVRVNDRDLARNLEVTTANLVDVFQALEQALGNPSTVVKVFGKREPRLRKRQK